MRATKEQDKVNMAWAHMKYTSVGVVEVDPVPNEPAIELPDLLQPPAPTAGKATGKAPAPTPGMAPAFSKASAPNGTASAPQWRGFGRRRSFGQGAPPRGSGQGAGVYRHPAAKEARP